MYSYSLTVSVEESRHVLTVLHSASYKAAVKVLAGLHSHCEAQLGKNLQPRSSRWLVEIILCICMLEGLPFIWLLAGGHPWVLDATCGSRPHGFSMATYVIQPAGRVPHIREGSPPVREAGSLRVLSFLTLNQLI